jgi:hypothetical protein
MSAAEGRNLANAVRDSMETSNFLLPLKDVRQAGRPVFDYLQMDPVTVARQPVHARSRGRSSCGRARSRCGTSITPGRGRRWRGSSRASSRTRRSRAAYILMLDTIALYERTGQVARANGMRLILRDLQAGYAAQAERSSRKADAYIKDRIRLTQRRPEGPAPHMRDHVISRPLPTTVPSGAFGIADIDELDLVVNPNYRQFGPYWRSQEFGLPVGIGARADRPAPGYFQPGDARPNPDEYGRHAYFLQEPYFKGMPALVRTRPLKARHFLRDGAALAYQWHREQSRRISREGIAAMTRL